MTDIEAEIVSEVVSELSYYCSRDVMLKAVARLNEASFDDERDGIHIWTTHPVGRRVRVASC